MTRSRAGVLAVRAVNQYRRRDILTYLGLRYYLENSAARNDTWARDVAVDLSIRGASPSYFSTLHFKDVDDRGAISYRAMSLPSANEALAESALIDECARVGGLLGTTPHVFSYHPATNLDRSGIFQPYMRGVRDRHAAIAAACKTNPDAEVLFIDIRNFYPSLKIERTLPIWTEAAKRASLSARFTLLGERLLHNHAIHTAKTGGHLLTGPMFSHAIGNLALRQLDEEISNSSVNYFRYVDDFTLVGTRRQIHASLDSIRKHLAQLDLELHDEKSPKTLSVSAKDWLQGEHDYTESSPNPSWPAFIGALKKLLLWYPESAADLSRALCDEEFRLPVPDYSGAIYEMGHLSWVRRFLSKHWYQSTVKKVSIATTLEQARRLRRVYETEMERLLEELGTATDYTRKRLLPKAKYTLGRLTYLAESQRLRQLADAASGVQGLFFQAEIARAVATQSIDRLITLGTNAAQAAAQPGRMLRGGFTLTRAASAPPDLLSLATIALNGVPIEVSAQDREQWTMEPLYRFAVSGADRELMRTNDVALKELACLHGINPARHSTIIDSPIDEAESITLDAIEQARESLSL